MLSVAVGPAFLFEEARYLVRVLREYSDLELKCLMVRPAFLAVGPRLSDGPSSTRDGGPCTWCSDRLGVV